MVYPVDSLHYLSEEQRKNDKIVLVSIQFILHTNDLLGNRG